MPPELVLGQMFPAEKIINLHLYQMTQYNTLSLLFTLPFHFVQASFVPLLIMHLYFDRLQVLLDHFRLYLVQEVRRWSREVIVPPGRFLFGYARDDSGQQTGRKAIRK